MRKVFLFLLALLVVLSLSAAALADSTITVNGTGEALVSADVAVISLGVSARDRDVLKAQAKVNEAIASIRAVLLENGIAKEDIITDYINIYAMYDYRDDQEEVAAYNANSTLAIRVTKMDAVGELIDLAFGAGANTLNGISFSASDTTEAKAEALRAAVRDAQEKAEVLAEAAGLSLGKVESIQEGSTYSYERGAGNFTMNVKATEDAAAGTVIQSAKLIVSASVSITFELDD